MKAERDDLPDFVNHTILNTPKPRASSTTQKQHVARHVDLQQVPFCYTPNTSADASSDSLGILSLDNYQLTSHLNSTGVAPPQFTNKKLQQQRSLVSSLLEKSSKGFGLPSRYLKPSDTFKSCASPTLSIGSDSTVNESDLLKPSVEKKNISDHVEKEKLSFKPADISTPRSSYDSSESFDQRQSIGRTSISKSLAEFSQQIRNSNTSLTDLCEQFSKLDSLNFSQTSLFNEESFVGGELALEKLKEQEKSWRRQYGALGSNSLGSVSQFSQLENVSSFSQERSSVTEFFRKKSELADFCLKESPEKDIPTPLIDRSLTSEQGDINQNLSASFENTKSVIDDSVLSISEIEKVIAANDNTTSIMEYMFQKPTKPVGKMEKASKNSASSTMLDDTKENQEPYEKYSNKIKFRSSSVEPLTESTNNLTDKSTISLHTAISLESLPGGKLPVESNRIELVWGCVSVGKKKTQSFILRNKSQNKLRFQLRTSNAAFKIVNDRSEADPMQILPVLLYPAESRLFSVSFTPSAIGAAVEKLSFTPISNKLQMQQTKRQQLNLYGYGGYANIEINNLLKDTNMKMWLPLGKLGDTLQLTQKFTVKNTGTLPAFSCFDFCSKTWYGHSKVVMYPSQVILKPKEQATVTVTYTPTKDDVKHVFGMTTNQIVEIGSVHILSGEESLRGRIRRLHKKVKQEGGDAGNPLIAKLSDKIVNEKMPVDVNKFTETVGCMKELLQNLVSKEIILTLERDSDCSMLGQIAGIEETSMFHSLAEGMSTIVSNTCPLGSCVVEPSSLILTPPTKIEDNIVLMNENAKSIQFQTFLSNDEVLEVSPSEGILAAGETALLKVSYNVKKVAPLQQQEYKLSIYVDDDMFEVDIKIILVSSKPRWK